MQHARGGTRAVMLAAAVAAACLCASAPPVDADPAGRPDAGALPPQAERADVADGTHRLALIVGLSQYARGRDYPLDWWDLDTRSDVALMRRALVERFGFADGDVLVITDAGATRQAVLDAFRAHLIARTQPGDTILVYFAGHGRQVLDDDGDEPDGLDECLVPFDYVSQPAADGARMGIRDDQVAALLRELRGKMLGPDGALLGSIAVVLDCGFAGGVTEDPSPDPRVRGRGWVECLDGHPPVAGGDAQPESASGLLGEWEALRSGYVVLSACRSDQTAVEVTDDAGCTCGALTHFLSQALMQARPGDTWRDVFDAIRGGMMAGHVRQTPQLEGEADAPLLGRGALPPMAETPCDYWRPLRVHLEGDDAASVLSGVPPSIWVAGSDPDRCDLRLAVNDGTVTLSRREDGGWAQVGGADAAGTLPARGGVGDEVHAEWTWRWLSQLRNHHPDAGRRISMRLVPMDVAAKDGGRGADGTACPGGLSNTDGNCALVREGDDFALEFRNLSGADAYVSLFDLTPGGSIEPLCGSGAATPALRLEAASGWQRLPGLVRFAEPYGQEQLVALATPRDTAIESFLARADGPHWASARLLVEVCPGNPEFDEALCELTTALPRHGAVVGDLMAVRGVPDLLSEWVGGVAGIADICGPLRKAHPDYPPGTSVLFYDHRHGVLRCWLIDQDGLRAYHRQNVPWRHLRAAIADLRRALGVTALQASRAPRKRAQRVQVGEAAGPPLERAVADVGGLLLPSPIAEALAGVRHLIVVPVEGIGTVPFALLEPPGTAGPLVEAMSVSVAPHLFDLQQVVETWSGRVDSALIVGNPDFVGDGEWLLPPLPGAEAEARAVARVLGARPIVGREATREAVVAGAADAGLLYFATHGVADEDDPLSGSFLALTPSGMSTGRWTPREIQEQHLNSGRLAVLSACQTGLGREHDAGVIGLARAFQIAGMSRVVVSLWSVDDEATARLMVDFVGRLAEHAPAEALRLAMLELRAVDPDPAHWASFALFGTPR